MKKYFSWVSGSNEDEKRMIQIIKNCKENNPRLSEKEMKTLCRISFICTYGKTMPSSQIDSIWKKLG